MERLGYLSVIDAIRLLEAGLPIYVVSAPTDTHAFPLEGAWVDDDGTLYLDCACICINAETAHKIGRAYNQKTILALYPTSDGNAEVYLFKDLPLARELALRVAGGYTADGEWLFTAVDTERASVFTDGYEEWVSVDMVFVPVK